MTAFPDSQAKNDLCNADLVPTSAAQRTWRWYHFSALWIGMVMCIPAYTLAASLVKSGMSWRQAVGTVFLGNVIVLLPMLLIGHAGARYGIPYAVLARASFGTHGAKLPALLRALVACGWYGIQTWFGGMMIYTLLGVLLGHPLSGDKLPLLGIDLGQLLCFLAFWVIQLYFVVHGIEAIRRLETWSAPIKIVICALLLCWAYRRADGFGPILAQPSRFAPGQPREGQFAAVFWPSLTAMVGFWATLALNIPDFTRFAKSQRDQVLGQVIGLPVPMGLLATLAVLVTSATLVIFHEALWDPVDLASRLTGAGVLIALLFLLVDTISVNLAANLVGPAYDFCALHPSRISYRAGGFITAALAVLMMPWKILESTQGYITIWLVGYSALLGPVAGILLADYLVLRRTRLDAEALYEEAGEYRYRKGWNPVAMLALAAGVAPNMPGFAHAALPGSFPAPGQLFDTLYVYAWFVGLAIGAGVYLLGTLVTRPAAVTATKGLSHAAIKRLKIGPTVSQPVRKKDEARHTDHRHRER